MGSSHIHKHPTALQPGAFQSRSYPGFGLLFACLLLAVIFLAGCGGSGADAQDGTPVPTPTRDPSGYQQVAPQACQAASFATMQSNQPQGALVAFRPGSHDLAYMQPTDRTSWFVGALTLAKAPDYKTQITLATNTLAAGDLTWSPDGTWLAFLAYRTSESLYTVMAVHADGKGLVDLFPTDAARTDSRTSQKSILKWKDDQTVEVMASCGEECRDAYDIRVDQADSTALVPTQVADYNDLLDSLKLHPNLPAYALEDFPKTMPTPDPAKTVKSQNWSPDNQTIAYIDKRGFPFILSVPNKVTYPLDIGLRDVYEMEWSSDSQSLALRAEDQIFIFEVPCKQGK